MDTIIKKDIVGYEGLYKVDSNGNIYNRSDRILSPLMGGDNSAYHHICLCRNGKVKQELIHRIVAIAFLDNPYDKPEVNHKNGNKLDNRLCNLEWSTKSENQSHRFRALHHSHFGEKNTQAKLTSEEVLAIVHLYKKGYPLGYISALFSISKPTICDIAKGRSWAHVTGIKPQRNIERMKALGHNTKKTFRGFTCHSVKAETENKC